MPVMPEPADMGWPVSLGLMVSLAVSALIVLTQRWHGALTFDTSIGPQKFHDAPTPRVGGLAVFAGFWVTASVIPYSPVRELMIAIGMSGCVVFLAGLAEDLTKRISVGWRLLAALLSGTLFCIMTGYSIDRVDIQLLDPIIGLPVVSFALTVFAMASMANAINMIDGFNGLATGAVIIMLSAFAMAAYLAGDYTLLWLAVFSIAALLGCMLLNFPYGLVFLGDGGAYFAGFVLAAIAVMLPLRNADVSAWVSVVILAYPVLEITHAVIRKTLHRGRRPTKPDKVHLHMLIYRALVKRTVKAADNKQLTNPMTSMLLWAGPMTGLAFVALNMPTWQGSMLAFALQTLLYVLVYRGIARFLRYQYPKTQKKPAAQKN